MLLLPNKKPLTQTKNGQEALLISRLSLSHKGTPYKNKLKEGGIQRGSVGQLDNWVNFTKIQQKLLAKILGKLPSPRFYDV